MSDEALIRLCVGSNDTDAWEEFLHRFGPPIARRVVRLVGTAMPSDVVDDLVQETYLKLCKDNFKCLREFEHRHPNAFYGYLQRAATSVVTDYFKMAGAKKRPQALNALSPDDFEPAGQDDPTWAILRREIAVFVRECAGKQSRDRNCTIFWLYFEQGMGAAEIACLPQFGLLEKGVDAMLSRMKRCVRGKVAARSAVGT